MGGSGASGIVVVTVVTRSAAIQDVLYSAIAGGGKDIKFVIGWVSVCLNGTHNIATLTALVLDVVCFIAGVVAIIYTFALG